MINFKFNFTLQSAISFCYRYGYHLSVNSYFICNDNLTIIKIFESLRKTNNQQNNVIFNYVLIVR